MKNIIFFISIFIIISLILFLSCDVLTKMNEQEWDEKNLDEDKEDIFYVYVAGYCDNGSGNDFLTIKYDESGRDSWVRIRDINNADRAFGITINNSGNIYIGGDINFGNNCYIIEYDNNGSYLNNNSSVFGVFNSLTCDPSNNVYATGTDVATFYTVKYNSGLTQILPLQTFDTVNDDLSYGISYFNNNIFVVGYSTFGDADLSIVKYDASNLNQLDVRYYPLVAETNGQQANDIVIDHYGNIYIIGSVSLGGGNYDLLLLKYDSSLDLLWDRIININTDDRGEGIDIDAAGNVYIVLYSGTGIGNYDCYTIKFDQFGNEIWRNQYGANGINEQLFDVAVDPKGNVYSVGIENNRTLLIKNNFYGYQLWIKSFNAIVSAKAMAVAIGEK